MHAPQRPVIGITGPDEGGAAAWLATAFAVWRAGGRPLRVRPARPCSAQRLHGLVIGGGADVAPELYGEAAQPMPEHAVSTSSRRLGRRLLTLALIPLLWALRGLLRSSHRIPGDAARDELESTLLAEADGSGLPVLGICRGAQLMNVHRGGSLVRDLGDFYMESTQITTLLPYKPVEVSPESRLAQVLGRSRCRVNSLHRHAVHETGDGVVVVAREASGVVQAIEDPQRVFFIGVQWHPEYLPQRPEQRRLFDALVSSARSARGG